jgi:hypothetical protein
VPLAFQTLLQAQQGPLQAQQAQAIYQYHHIALQVR